MQARKDSYSHAGGQTAAYKNDIVNAYGTIREYALNYDKTATRVLLSTWRSSLRVSINCQHRVKVLAHASRTLTANWPHSF
jgi:hypothetical protein